MRCRFMSGHCDTTVVIFILSQLQLLLTSNKPFYIAFINREGQHVGSVHAFNQQEVGATDALHDQGHEKKSPNWQL